MGRVMERIEAGTHAALNAALWVYAGVGLLIVAGLVALHLGDRFLVIHVDGAWMALAQAARDGLLYPPLFDGTHYGGTRFMPVPILLHAGLAALTGEYLTSGKLFNAVAATALAVVVYRALGAYRLHPAQRAALAVAFWLSTPGLSAIASIRNDALPVLLQLAALLWVERGLAGRGARDAGTAAGVLCALAVLCKFSALWGPAAIATVLLLRDRRALLGFALAMGLSLLAGLVAVQLLSDGRFLENLLGLAFSGAGEPLDMLRNLRRLPRNLGSEAQVTALLLPIAALAAGWAAVRRQLTLRHWAFGYAGLVTLAIYTDAGAWSNHLIDLAVLATLLSADLWARCARPAGLLLGGLLLAAGGTAVLSDHAVSAGLRAAVSGTAFARDPFAGRIGPQQTLLSEDPYVPVMLGRRPVVLDAFMLRHLQERRPEAVQPLVQRIRRQDFDWVVLLIRAETASPRQQYRRFHFGAPVWQAILTHYSHVTRIGPGLHLYRRAAPSRESGRS